MLASQHFKIRKSSKDDWYDAILNNDTQLFVDPFLVFKEAKGFWATAHERIVKHFEQAFLLVAQGNLNEKSLPYKKALHLLNFKEPREFCLGYTVVGTKGSGSGSEYARRIAGAISEAIRRGLEHPTHFEELGVLNEGIGPDRISDITCTVLKSQFVQYTREVAKRHSIPLYVHKIYGSTFDDQRLRWNSAEVEMPTNPFTGGPFLFVPRRFLSELPALNSDDWWEYYQAEQLREDVNYEIMQKVDKKTIIETARRHPELVRKWTEDKEGAAVSSYSFEKDPNGLYQWDPVTQQFAQQNPLVLPPPQSEEEFFGVIELVIQQFKLFIEEQGGWDLLWNSPHEKEKPEQSPQLLFRGMANSYCRANNISIDREVNLGRGPVDFKFSNGYSRRAHLEVKKLHNGKFWNGLSEQLPSYLTSDEVRDGWFLAIRYRDGKLATDRIRQLPAKVRIVGAKRGLNLRYALIDGRPKASASKL